MREYFPLPEEMSGPIESKWESSTVMKGMKKGGARIYIAQLTLTMILSAGWWGILYPNFSMTEDTFQALEQDEAQHGKAAPDESIQEAAQDKSVQDKTETFFAMLNASPGEIQLKSRLLETIARVRGRENES